MPDDKYFPPARGVSPARPCPAALPRHPGADHWARLLGAHDPLPIDPDLEPAAGRRRPRARVLAAIFAGGCLGTLARYGVGQAWPTPSGHFPAATFVINTSGAFLLGLVLTVLLERHGDRAPTVRRFAGAGVLGGWTTYSTLVVEALSLAKAGHVSLAAGYIALTLVSGVTAVALGIGLGRTRAATRLAQADAAAGAADAAHADGMDSATDTAHADGVGSATDTAHADGVATAWRAEP